MPVGYDIEDNTLLGVAINAALTTQDIVAAPTDGSRIVVFGWWFQAASAVNAKWAHGSTDFFPLITLTAGQMITEKLSQKAVLICGVNEALKLILSGTVQCSGYLYYQLTKKAV